MRRLVHLSDLHFGRANQALLGPLIDTIRQLGPDIIVVSGDLTQRARSSEFQQARRFLDALPARQIIVPGNHDVPLYNLFDRMLRPLENYRRYIADDPEPVFVDDEIVILGINSARSMTLKGGRVSVEQMARLRWLARLGERRTKIIVTHHPFDLPETRRAEGLIGGAHYAMDMFSACEIDLLLAGHSHASHAGSTAKRYQRADYSALVVQAGTATSTRARGEANSFNVLDIERCRVEFRRFAWDAESAAFRKAEAGCFEKIGRQWHSARDAMAGAAEQVMHRGGANAGSFG